jgi:hypothetical protein
MNLRGGLKVASKGKNPALACHIIPDVQPVRRLSRTDAQNALFIIYFFIAPYTFTIEPETTVGIIFQALRRLYNLSYMERG